MAAKAYKLNGDIGPNGALPDGIRRIAAAVEYNGSGYHGFQVQKHDTNTVQEHLQQALSAVAAEEIKLVCAGRTDAGVHASNQIIHFDTSVYRPDKAWIKGVNTNLPRDIRVHWANEVPGRFHARFSATSRRYRYLICDRAVAPGIMLDQLSWSRYGLDLALMKQGAQCLIGEHDFTSFRASQCQAKTAVRTIERIDFCRYQDSILVMEIQASAFLYHMVRNIAGVLMAVGRGKHPVSWVAEVLAQRDRRVAEATAPAAGLYFVAANYPAEFQLPAFNLGPHLLPNNLDWI
jgi:tRNA pseudouridine38-40 synthase